MDSVLREEKVCAHTRANLIRGVSGICGSPSMDFLGLQVENFVENYNPKEVQPFIECLTCASPL